MTTSCWFAATTPPKKLCHVISRGQGRPGVSLVPRPHPQCGPRKRVWVNNDTILGPGKGIWTFQSECSSVKPCYCLQQEFSSLGMNNYRATAVTCGYSMITNARHHKPRPLRHKNQPGLPDFSRVYTLKNMGRPGYEARNLAQCRFASAMKCPRFWHDESECRFVNTQLRLQNHVICRYSPDPFPRRGWGLETRRR